MLLVGCRETTTTLRFVDNREAVAVYNFAHPKAGDNVEGLINTEKKLFFMYPSGTFDFHFDSSVRVEPGEQKLFASFTTAKTSLRITVLRLKKSLPVAGPPTN